MKFTTKPLNIFHHTLSMFSHYTLGNSPRQRPSTPARAMCDFSSRQRVPPDLWPANSPEPLTLIRLITGSVTSSNSECTIRGCTTLMNWNSVCSTCGVTSTRASLTMQLTSGASVFGHACRRTADTSSKCCTKQYTCVNSTVWQHKSFIFVKFDTLFDFLL